MSGTHVVAKNGETLTTISKAQNIDLGKLLALNPKLERESALKIGQVIRLEWTRFSLSSPKVIAIATDKYLTPTTPFPDAASLSGVPAPKYGQDITFGLGRVAPAKQDVGKTPADLAPKMRYLAKAFGSADKTGMVDRLFSAFLKKQPSVIFFDDGSLNLAASKHPNIVDFCDLAMFGS